MKEVSDPYNLLKYQNIVSLKTSPPIRTDSDYHRETKYVYVISHPLYRGEYKVGIAKDVKSRLNSYQTSDPRREYKLEFKYETPWYRELEKHIHHKFDNNHEWVSADLKTVIAEIKSCQPIPR